MEFWGVEVKHGVPLHVDPGEDMIVHISQAALGENKNNVNEPIRLYLKVGDQKLIIGTLSHDKFPQLVTEIVLERDFELSHSWKNGSVFFSGYKVDAAEPEDENMTDDEPAVASDKGVKQVNFQLPNEDVKAKQDDDDDSEEESSDDEEISSSEESGDEEEKKVTAEVDSDEDDSSDDDEDDSSDEDTPKKPEEPKKRSAEANSSKNTASSKKAKFVTPQKTETKKPHVHIDTPHPSKQAGGSSNGQSSKQQQTPKSAGAFGCKSCSRTFTSEMGLQSHTKAKHSAAA